MGVAQGSCLRVDIPVPNATNLSSSPDRQASSFADGLQTHPGVEFISRDRADSYAEDQKAVDYCRMRGSRLSRSRS